MEIKQYKKEMEYSYSLGAFPTLELINNKNESIYKIIIHSSFDNQSVLDEIKKKVPMDKIVFNDKLVNKLSDKGNCFIIGVFYKYNMTINKSSNHLLLDNPSNMGNLGTIIRSSLGFNITNIAIIRPGVDIFDPKVIRSSMGSIFSVSIEYFNSLEEYKAKYDNKIYSFMLKAKNKLNDIKLSHDNITLAFGNEATGLSDNYLDDNSIIIEHEKTIDSLNITNAVSIALYEYYNQVGKNKC